MAKILILDEHRSKSGTFFEMLEKLGHKVLEAKTVGMVVQQFAGETADILFVLQQSENCSVIESLRLLKGESCLHDVPIVVVTAAANSDEVIEAMKLGAFDHLSNSVSIQDLDSVISRALSAPRQSKLLDAKAESNSLLIGN